MVFMAASSRRWAAMSKPALSPKSRHQDAGLGESSLADFLMEEATP